MTTKLQTRARLGKKISVHNAMTHAALDAPLLNLHHLSGGRRAVAGGRMHRHDKASLSQMLCDRA
jgi:hypothetical protein